eukprot:gene15344-18194_t
MRSMLAICALFVCISVAAATLPPPPPPPPHPSQFTLSTKVIGTWVDGSRGNKVYTQYDVTIHNNSPKNIKNFKIDTDYTFKLRDSSSLWNVVRVGDDLSLPAYQPSVNSHASYTFGFILEGTTPAHLYIQSVDY